MVSDAVRDVVRRQAEAGLDVVTDGEQGKVSFLTYVKERLAGFDQVEGETLLPPSWQREIDDFPEYYHAYMSKYSSAVAPMRVMVCTGPVAYVGRDALATDIANLRAALADPGRRPGRGVPAVHQPQRLRPQRLLLLRAGLPGRGGRSHAGGIPGHRRVGLPAAGGRPLADRDPDRRRPQRSGRAPPPGRRARGGAQPRAARDPGGPDQAAHLLRAQPRSPAERHPAGRGGAGHAADQRGRLLLRGRQPAAPARVADLGRRAAGRGEDPAARAARARDQLRRASRAHRRRHLPLRRAWSAGRTSSPAPTAGSPPGPASRPRCIRPWCGPSSPRSPRAPRSRPSASGERTEHDSNTVKHGHENPRRHRRPRQHRHRPAGQAPAQRARRGRLHGRRGRVRRPGPGPRARPGRLGRGPGLAAAPGPAAAAGVRGHLGEGARGQRAALPRGRDAGHRPDPGRARAAGLPAGQPARPSRLPEHQHDQLRRPGHGPDRARRLLGRPGALRGDRRVGGVPVGRPGHPGEHRRVHPHHVPRHRDRRRRGTG